MDDKSLSEKESLQLIADMITQAKNHYYESGMGALLWGFSNLICFGLAWLDVYVTTLSLPFNPFYLMVITVLLQVYYDRRERKFRTAVTYKDEAHKYVWITFGISVLILTTAGAFANIGYFVLPLLLLLFAMPTFISGCISRFSPFIVGGIVCWILCIISFFYRSYNTYLLVALGATVAWIIPGFILRARFYSKVVKRKDGV